MSRKKLIKKIVKEAGIDFVSFKATKENDFIVRYNNSRVHVHAYEDCFGVYIFQHQRPENPQKVFEKLNKVANGYYLEMCYEYSKERIQKLYDTVNEM